MKLVGSILNKDNLHLQLLACFQDPAVFLVYHTDELLRPFLKEYQRNVNIKSKIQSNLISKVKVFY